MYVDPEVVRRAHERSGDEGAPLAPLLEAQPAIGAPGLVELVGWDGAGPPALGAARLAARAFRVLPLTAYEVFLAADLVRNYPGLPSRAALHVAIMLNHGELEIVSDDAVFDRVPEVRRVPTARLAQRLGRRRAAPSAR